MPSPSPAASAFVKESGSITLIGALIIIAVPLLVMGKYWIGCLMIAMCVLLAVKDAANGIDEYEKQQIRCNVMDSKDIVKELISFSSHPDATSEQIYTKFQATLGALAKKYASPASIQDPNMPLFCQQVAYMALKRFPKDLDLSSDAMSLLALVAKDKRVRERHKHQADVYGLDVPIKAMKIVMEQAKNEENEEKENSMAEFQRRGCLFLGAVADEDKELNLDLLVVEEGGLEAILDAASWYRCHSGVSNWALWALFVLCYQNSRNKLQLMRLDGINAVCQSLENNTDSLDVCRHGIAILFDLLRSGQEDKSLSLDPWKIRKLALAAGLHKVAKAAMESFPGTMDIMMMGQEMLIGTGYQGIVPQYEMPKE